MQQESALNSIRVGFDPDSNVNVESDWHQNKEPSPRNSTEAGRQIDSNDEHFECEFPSIRVSIQSRFGLRCNKFQG
jgi:hypothetical protein